MLIHKGKLGQLVGRGQNRQIRPKYTSICHKRAENRNMIKTLQDSSCGNKEQESRGCGGQTASKPKHDHGRLCTTGKSVQA